MGLGVKKENRCHLCGKQADWVCEDCDEIVCDECTTPYNQFTQVDWTQCNECGNGHAEERNAYYIREAELEAKLERRRLKRNRLAKKRYHSPKQVEIRRRNKIKKNLAAREWHKRFWEIMGRGIFAPNTIKTIIRATEPKNKT